MNFNSIFEELNKLYEDATVENYEDELGRKAWSKNAMGYYDQAAKELGLTNFSMQMVKKNGEDYAIISATKDDKNLSAEEAFVQETHNVRNVEDAKSYINYVFGLDESLTEAAEDEEIEFAEEPVAPIEEPTEEARQLILECSKCGAIVIQDEADVVVDEESDLANVEDECEYCEEKAGYEIIGVVAPYEAAEEVAEEVAEEEPVEEALQLESKSAQLNALATAVHKAFEAKNLTDNMNVSTVAVKCEFGSGGHITIQINDNISDRAADIVKRYAMKVLNDNNANAEIANIKRVRGMTYVILDNIAMEQTQAIKA